MIEKMCASHSDIAARDPNHPASFLLYPANNFFFSIWSPCTIIPQFPVTGVGSFIFFKWIRKERKKEIMNIR